jgi:hypothetical protein
MATIKTPTPARVISIEVHDDGHVVVDDQRRGSDNATAVRLGRHEGSGLLAELWTAITR